MDSPWARLAEQVPAAIRILVVGLAVTLLVAWRPLRNGIEKETDSPWPVSFAWRCLVAHLAALACYLSVTEWFLQGEWLPVGWMLAWVVSGLVSCGLLALTIFPAQAWSSLVPRYRRVFATGLGVGVAALVAGHYTVTWWQPLCASTIFLARLLLSLVTDDVVCEPDKYRLGTSTYQCEIEPACSGYEGIGLIWVFLGAYLCLRRHQLRFPHALLLLPLGTLLIWLANGLRLASLILIGTYWSPDISERGFHSQAGWLAFNGVALGLVALSVRWDVFRRRDQTIPDVELTNPAAPYLVPFLVLMATLMLCAAFSVSFDYLYPIRVLTVGTALLWFFGDYRRWPWDWSWQAMGIGFLVFALWLALEPLTDKSAKHETAAAEGPFSAAVGMPAALAATWLVFRVFGSVLIVPLAEELAFRGFFIRRLQATDFQGVPATRLSWLALVVSSVLFGLLHNRWLAGSLAGMLFALALYRRGRIADAVLAHATANALIAAYVIPTGAWSLWA